MDKLRAQLNSRTGDKYWQLRTAIKVENANLIADWGDSENCSKPAVLVNKYIQLLGSLCHYLGVDNPTEAIELVTTQHLKAGQIVGPVSQPPSLAKSKPKFSKSEAEAALDLLM